MLQKVSISTLVLILLWLTSAGRAAAQDPSDAGGVRVSGVFGGANARSTTDFSFAGSFGYRFDRFLGVEFEVAGIPDIGRKNPFDALSLASGVRGVTPLILPIERDGRAVLFTANFRSDIPTGRRWLIPYFAAGGGVASFRERIRLGAFDDRQLLPTIERFFPSGSGVQFSSSGAVWSALQSVTIGFPGLPRDSSSTSTDLTLDFGGGVSFLIVKGLSADADVRYYRVFANTEFNLVRFGTGASYRF